MKQKTNAHGPKGSRQVRQEKRGGTLRWGYHVWLRQPDGSRKQVRDFSFNTKAEAKEALRAIQTASRKERYGLVPSKKYSTTIETAINRFKALAQAKRILRRAGADNASAKTTKLLSHAGPFSRWSATERKIRYVCEIDEGVLQYWIATEVISTQNEVGIVRR